jgi:alginate O-acetyltransferase complex protein AlgI
VPSNNRRASASTCAGSWRADVLFNSLEYLIFLPVTWVLFWAIPSRRLELMLVASYVFYASWSVPYAAMVFGLVVLNYLFGLALGRAVQHRKLVLSLFVAFDLAVLGVFKYLDFGLSSLAGGANALLGTTWEPTLLRIVLPLGISFFTFEFIHYLVDIYRGDVPEHSFSKFHVFAAFFPTQIAGPIKRFQQFIPSLSGLGSFDKALAAEGLWLVGRGLAKKILIADRLSPMVNRGFAQAAAGGIGGSDAWISALGFALQIFFDFSGYTDIARGSAALLGFRIPINFDAPYLATSLSDFWRRWHISLSTWLRDYIYIPLGGSRVSRVLVTRNLLITFLLGGLWHGAAWHFVAWGGLWGIGLSIQHILRDRVRLPRTPPVLVGQWIGTQIFVLVGWVLFRADNFDAAGAMLRAMVGFGTGTGVYTARAVIFIGVVAAGLLLASMAGRRSWRIPIPRPLGGARPVALGVAAALVLVAASLAAPTGREAFIYFQF